MSDLVKRLRDLGRYDDDDLLIQAADEIERLTACVEHHQAVEADQERAIERLQSELEVWKANAETNLGEVERLQAAVDGLRQNRDLAYEKEKRLRAALERIEAYDGPVTDASAMMREIAGEALRDDVEYAPNGMAYDD